MILDTNYFQINTYQRLLTERSDYSHYGSDLEAREHLGPDQFHLPMNLCSFAGDEWHGCRTCYECSWLLDRLSKALICHDKRP